PCGHRVAHQIEGVSRFPGTPIALYGFQNPLIPVRDARKQERTVVELFCFVHREAGQNRFRASVKNAAVANCEGCPTLAGLPNIDPSNCRERPRFKLLLSVPWKWLGLDAALPCLLQLG